MIKEVTAIRAGRPGERDLSNGLSLFWLSILLLALLGVIVAACSKAPVIWMLVWPTPLILIFTTARFIREGFHKRDGVLVLGRPVPSQLPDLSDPAGDDENVEPPIVIADPLSVLGPTGRVEVARALDLAMKNRAAEDRARLVKRLQYGRRSLAHT
jgi:hypothetical protein